MRHELLSLANPAKEYVLTEGEVVLSHVNAQCLSGWVIVLPL